jgi:phenylalanyl-tRNA synthetase alpha chain
LKAAGSATAARRFDPTLPGLWRGPGVRHPITLVIEEAIRIFSMLGFTVADGPDIETEYHNFDALNTPADHPSRDIQDTFWLASGQLLRTQTSPVQIRVMENRKPPVRIIAPGRCYRRDTTDATHSANFHQIEGLYVDREVSMADLKGDITFFAHQMMGKDVKVRFRPHFFPFTEPSVEYDFSCHLCGGQGCRVCKHSGWIEISGAGMVNPKVFRTVGYDPDTTTGYAFGMGVERIAMIKYGIEDIRHLYDNDVRFLEQFRSTAFRVAVWETDAGRRPVRQRVRHESSIELVA